MLSTFQEFTIRPESGSHRLLPLILFWAADDMELEKPVKTHWVGGGSMPVAFHRSDWDPEATYIAIKGGAANLSHAHMDVGSFILEMNGVRWAIDLGMENYTNVEKEGIQLWDRKQTGERWDIFRLGSFSHNILTVNGEQQRVEGQAEIARSTGDKNQESLIDLSPVYEG